LGSSLASLDQISDDALRDRFRALLGRSFDSSDDARLRAHFQRIFGVPAPDVCDGSPRVYQ